MESKKIRQTFLDFFASKGHKIVPSAPMVLKDDPTLMFTNAGMNPFKDLFLGNSTVKHPRVADTQKCLRVSGKHNDLEEVGVDTYHHTMFEMLGNWSFGDYFKEEAIAWAWDLLTEHYDLNKEDLYVTVFEGDKEDNLPIDEEAREHWKKYIAEDRILLASKKDNFWEMGETGPCGPCSEIHIDLRSDEEKKATPGIDLVNKDHPQVVEVWNLVFIEFNRLASGKLQPLSAKHVDTGMGLERLAMAIQSKKSNYDTDVFSPLLKKLSELSGKEYTAGDDSESVAFRVIVDHVRAVSFSICDGQLPSNNKAGYVIRRILRRAIRYGYSFLDFKEPFIYNLVDSLNESLGNAFPELEAQKDLIKKVIKQEEESFLRTLDKGINRLEEHLKNMKEGDMLSGVNAFELYDTFGFPSDLTALIAGERGIKINEAEFSLELQAQINRSRADGKVSTDDWIVLHDVEKVDFVGYDNTTHSCKIARYRRVRSKGDDLYQVVLDSTPFYPEGGGQVGDTGTITCGDSSFEVTDTKKENNLIVHTLRELPNDTSATFEAEVNADLQLSSARNHSATHLLHESLKSILGNHVEQKGSLVRPENLRFDFSHFERVDEETISKIEQDVNKKILANISLDERRDIPLAEAQAAGAIMLFGEKYGEHVRMIGFGTSKELCGGIHVPATGSIGLFRITSESSVASGVRRIEAVTGEAAYNASLADRKALNTIGSHFKGAKNVVKAVKDMQTSLADLNKEVEGLRKKEAGNVKDDLVKDLKVIDGINFLAVELNLDAKSVKDLAFQLKAEHAPFVGVFAIKKGTKAYISVAISDDVIADRGLKAGDIVKELAQFIRGGGGGQPMFASAGGPYIEGIKEALSKAEGLL
ncbi:MAG: alanine--tRNA ligase [Crocinitomicaceae bacterium]|nr:alanine--tRNA ligase [Crocinitomicaceae bacterium]|tara:strand:- start:375 stop:2984 length:2610 start_codon:yes stop_codon:yes gene_type:complete